MEVKCWICGSKVNLPKFHKDYQRLADNPEDLYVCEKCQRLLNLEAKKQQKTPPPI